MAVKLQKLSLHFIAVLFVSLAIQRSASCAASLHHKQCEEAFFDEQGAKNFREFESDCHVLRR